MQPDTHQHAPKILSPGLRRLLGLLIGIVPLLLIAGAICIPFFFESSSILYKFGLNRQLLLAGQVLGLAAGCLLLLQVVLGARLKCLDRVYGLNRLFNLHRLNGFIIAAAVIIHPILIFISDDRLFIPFQWRYWPEFVGLFLVLLIVAMVVSSHWRVGLRLAFHRWWPMHRAVAILVIILLGVHVLFVSDTFEQKLPKMLAFGALTLSGLVFLWVRTRRWRDNRNPYVVSAVEPAGDDAVCLQIISNARSIPGYLPGQFGFITLLSSRVSKEEHPFTMASSPTRPECLEFVVRTSGDWTAQLTKLQPQDRVLVNGPFGQFSHLMLVGPKEMIMIAGGIGITPMLSMLRYMADCDDPRKITLIWSNQTPDHIVLPQEFEKLAAQLKGLRIVHVLTRTPEYGGEKGRLDRPKLERLLSDCSRSAAVFICGPDQMMKDLSQTLVTLKFRRKLIFMERFSL